MSMIVTALLIVLVLLIIPLFGLLVLDRSIPIILWTLIGGDVLFLIGALISVYILAFFDMWNVAEEEHKKLGDELLDLQNKTKPPKQANIELRSLATPKYRIHNRVGFVLKNNEIQDITGIQMKLLNAMQYEFSDKSGYAEDWKLSVEEDNRYFNIGKNNKVGADNEEPFYFAERRGKQIFLLFNKDPFPIKYRYPHVQKGFNSHYITIDIEFEIHGKISGEPFNKERYRAVIQSHRIIPTTDTTIDDSVSINIKKEIIRVT